MYEILKVIQEKISPVATRNVHGVPLSKLKRKFLKNTFFPSAIIEWNKLDPTIKS